MEAMEARITAILTYRIKLTKTQYQPRPNCHCLITTRVACASRLLRLIFNLTVYNYLNRIE